MKKNSLSKKVSWKLVAYFFVAVFIIAAFFSFSYLSNLYKNIFRGELVLEESTLMEACPDCVRRFIDGVWVKPGEENLVIASVILDNHPDARPILGLAQANLVYEAEAEGGITRYLAFFTSDQNLEKIGPVRSVRPYFVDWAEEISPLMAHCGGSPEALVKVVKSNVYSLNEFYNGSYYWRDKDMPRPHNIFTSSENLNKFLDKKNWTESKFSPWQFKDPSALLRTGDSLLEEIKNPTIKIGYSSPVLEDEFIVEWQYDEENNDYIRYLGGDIHKTGKEKIIKAKNVIIQYADAEVIDDELRLKMKTVGKDKVVICLDGECQEGEWRKDGSTARTRYYYKSGKEVEFNAGTTWVEVVRLEIEVSY